MFSGVQGFSLIYFGFNTIDYLPRHRRLEELGLDSFRLSVRDCDLSTRTRKRSPDTTCNVQVSKDDIDVTVGGQYVATPSGTPVATSEVVTSLMLSMRIRWRRVPTDVGMSGDILWLCP